MSDKGLFRGFNCGCGCGDNYLIWIVIAFVVFCCTDILDCICEMDSCLIWIILIVLLLCNCQEDNCDCCC